MRNKRVGYLLLIIVLISALTVAMIGCDGGGGQPTPPPDATPPDQNTPEDDFGTPGYTRASVSKEDMASDLIRSISNGLKRGSYATVGASKPYAAALIRFDIQVNDLLLKGEITADYDHKNPDRLIYTLKIDNQDNTIIAFHFFGSAHNASGNPELYVKLGETQVIFPMDGIEMPVFPLKFEEKTFEGLETVFKAFIKLKDSIQYEYKDVANARERHYRFSLNFKDSLNSLYSLSSLFGQYGFSNFDKLVEYLFGVTEDDLKDGNFPECEIVGEFTTVGGRQTAFGYGDLTKFTLNFNVEESENKNTVFAGQQYEMTLNLTTFTIVNTKASETTGMKVYKPSDLKGYEYYSNRGYRFDWDANLKGSEGDFGVKATVQFDGLTQKNDEMLLAIYQRDSGKTLYEIDYRDLTLRLKATGEDGSTRTATCAYDFDTLMSGLRQALILRLKEFSMIDTLVFVMGSVNFIDEATMKVNFDGSFLSEVLGLDYEMFNEIILAAAPHGDLQDAMALVGLSEENLKLAFSVTLDLNKELFEKIPIGD